LTLEVVDRDERQPAWGGDRLRRADADQQGADQARAGRDRDGSDVVQRRSGLAQGGLDYRRRQLEMVPRGDLGHHAAELGVCGRLRGDRVGEHARAVQHRGAGVVARGLYRQC
jgi:hypothetical protein